MSIKVGVSGVVRSVNSAKAGVSGVVRNVTEGFCGVGGTARRFFGVPPSGSTTLTVEYYDAYGTALTVTTPREQRELAGSGTDFATLDVEVGDDVILLGEMRIVASGGNCTLTRDGGFKWIATITAFNPWISVETN